MLDRRPLIAKKALYQAIVRNLGKFHIPADHVKVLLRESQAENWGIRGGVPASEVELGFKIRSLGGSGRAKATPRVTPGVSLPAELIMSRRRY